MTTQRTAIYNALCATTAHPTAEELFLMVRGQMAGISLATVYNTLEMLVQEDMALKITGKRSARYDATCTPHAHARCLRCDSVFDLPRHDMPEFIASLPMPEGFVAKLASIEVEGVCKACVTETTGSA